MISAIRDIFLAPHKAKIAQHEAEKARWEAQGKSKVANRASDQAKASSKAA